MCSQFSTNNFIWFASPFLRMSGNWSIWIEGKAHCHGWLFSCYIPGVIHLASTTSSAIIDAMKTIFLWHGNPQTLVSDNGPQLTSSEMKQFATNYGFQHITSSPYHPQSNVLVEHMVQTIKKLNSETDDPCLTLLSCRATPPPRCNLSPSELLMGRKVRKDVPQSVKSPILNWPHLTGFAQKDREYKNQQKRNLTSIIEPVHYPFLPERTPVRMNMQRHQTPDQIVGLPAIHSHMWLKYLLDRLEGIILISTNVPKNLNRSDWKKTNNRIQNRSTTTSPRLPHILEKGRCGIYMILTLLY